MQSGSLWTGVGIPDDVVTELLRGRIPSTKGEAVLTAISELNQRGAWPR